VIHIRSEERGDHAAIREVNRLAFGQATEGQIVDALRYGLTCQWDVPADVFMVKLLDPTVGDRLQGTAQYRAECSAAG